ncbi:MAG: hypothetical protein Q8865_03775 [Bacillota bacterium]|nr:hypothetical protein [Bacillota bacterium]
MKIHHRITALMLSALMIVPILGGCQRKITAAGAKANLDPAAKQRLENLNPNGEFPIVKQPITLKFMVGQHEYQKDYANILVWGEYEKKTNIHIDWNVVPNASIKEKRNLVLASGQDLPDGFYRCSFGSKDVQKYGEQGLFLKINDLIDSYMPNFKKLTTSMDSVRKSLPDAEGNIYALPAIQDAPEVQMHPKLFINKKFMDKIGVKKLPTTTDEFYELCKAMRDKDANGNGKADEIALTSNSWGTILRGLYGAYGLQNKGYRNANVDLDPKTNKLRFIPTAPEFRQLLEYVHKMYAEKLLDNDIFQPSATLNTNIIAKSSMDLVGGLMYINLVLLSNDKMNDFTGIEEALKGPNGDKQWNAIMANNATKGAFAFSKTNPYPEATARWLDYWYSDEGSRMFYLGVEGKTYFKDTDGKYKFKPEVLKSNDPGQNYDAIVSTITPFAGGGNPTLLLSKYFTGNEMADVPAKAAKDLYKYAPKEVWDYFIYTTDEMDRMASLEADMLTGYYNNVVPEFISGKRPINDQTWNDYVAQYDKMGLSEYMEIYNRGYERYKKA